MKKYLLFLPFFIFQSCIFLCCDDDDVYYFDPKTVVAYQYHADYKDGERIPKYSPIYYFKQDSLKQIDSLKGHEFLSGEEIPIRWIRNDSSLVERLDPYDTIFKYFADNEYLTVCDRNCFLRLKKSEY